MDLSIEKLGQARSSSRIYRQAQVAPALHLDHLVRQIGGRNSRLDFEEVIMFEASHRKVQQPTVCLFRAGSAAHDRPRTAEARKVNGCGRPNRTGALLLERTFNPAVQDILVVLHFCLSLTFSWSSLLVYVDWSKSVKFNGV